MEFGTLGTSVSQMLTSPMPQSSPEGQHHFMVKHEVIAASAKEALPEDFIVYNFTRNKDIFGPQKIDIGGVGIALDHGSILIEYARY